MGFAGHMKGRQDELSGSATQTFEINLTVFVRAMPDSLPTQREVENKASRLLLDMPRVGEEGYEGWDVSGTSIPETKD